MFLQHARARRRHVFEDEPSGVIPLEIARCVRVANVHDAPGDSGIGSDEFLEEGVGVAHGVRLQEVEEEIVDVRNARGGAGAFVLAVFAVIGVRAVGGAIRGAVASVWSMTIQHAMYVIMFCSN